MDPVKRQHILDHAVRAFSKAGFKKASVDEIAREARVAKGTVYLYCQSKEDLFYQAVHRELRGWIGDVSKMIDPREPADLLMQQISTQALAVLESRPLVRDLLIGLFDGTLPGWASRFEELKALGRANVVELVKLGQRQGLFREDLDVEAVAFVLHEMQLLGLSEKVRPGGEQDTAVLLRRGTAAFDLVMNGLRRR
jgi:TetR/AcrR family fatty acid metabolism transcriptional regulator